MKNVLYNDDNLTLDQIDESVIRTKGLIINSKDEITLCYSHGTFQFPGGHLEDGETLNECLIREIKEETGIVITDVTIQPFARIAYYNKNYHNSGKNRKNEVYYFIIKTDQMFNMNNSQLDEWEQEGHFTVKVLPIKNVEHVLINSIPDNPINKVIVKEMLVILKEYNRIKMIEERKN